jgi:hypothetical protein
MRWEIIGAARALSQLRQTTYFPTEDHQKKHRAEMEKYERIIWYWPKDDPFEQSFTNAVATIEKFARPLLESRLRPRKSRLTTFVGRFSRQRGARHSSPSVF